MIGAIIGDVVGSRFEFNNTREYNFRFLHKDCDFTDDTILTIAVADTLVECGTTAKAEDFLERVLKWCNRYPNPTGAYGASFARWLRTPDHAPYKSFGNGAAMRLSPIIYASRNLAEAKRLAIECVRISHDHTEALIAAEAVITAGYLLHHGAPKDEVCNRVIAEFYGELPEFTIGRFDETCQYCVPLAFEIFKNSADFEDAIRMAVSFGGDSDTLAAIVGTLAESHYGLPEHLADFVVNRFIPADMIDVIVAFEAKFR
jgi:ADP-ribosylglycohydrolase